MFRHRPGVAQLNSSLRGDKNQQPTKLRQENRLVRLVTQFRLRNGEVLANLIGCSLERAISRGTMVFTETALRGAFLIDLQRRDDERGFFARAFCQHEFEAHSLKPVIAQANIGFNRKKGTLRGMHFQYPPAAETKLVRCSRGAILDVIVDLRPESPTYLQHVTVELSGDNRRGIYVPERFAHGYQALEDDTETTYHVGAFYTPGSEGGLPYDDPRLAITWPLPISVMSSKDGEWAPLAEVEDALRSRMRVG
jgi:dTDP-4-dehydrorhamnose 3,5-epimerase